MLPILSIFVFITVITGCPSSSSWDSTKSPADMRGTWLNEINNQLIIEEQTITIKTVINSIAVVMKGSFYNVTREKINATLEEFSVDDGQNWIGYDQFIAETEADIMEDYSVSYELINNSGTLHITDVDTTIYRKLIPLTINSWKDGEILDKERSDWYSFDVDNETIYRLWINGKWGGDDTKTLGGYFNAFYSDGTVIFQDYTEYWDYPRSFTANKNGTVYIQIKPYYDDSQEYFGTYSLAYSTNIIRPGFVFPPSSHAALTENEWKDGKITVSGNEDWYSFNTDSGTTYRVWLNNGSQGDSTKTFPAYISAWYSDGTIIFSGISYAWDVPRSFTATKNDLIYINVRTQPEAKTTTGTYSIVYSNTQIVRPGMVWPPVINSALSINEWKNGEIAQVNGEVWYSMNVTQSAYNRIWLNDSNLGDGTKTLNAKMSAFYSDGTAIQSNMSSTWHLPWNLYSNKNDTVYIKVSPDISADTGRTGTFSIAYSDGYLRPGTVLPPAGCIELIEGQFTDGNINSFSGENWYSFNVENGTTYNMWWNDRQQEYSNMYAYVNAYYSDGTSIFTNATGAWNTPRSFTANRNGTIYIKVFPVSGANYGTGEYRIVYSKNGVRPGTPWPPVSKGLASDQIITDSLANAAAENWYSIDVTNGNDYRIWWNDGYQNSSYMHINVSAYYSDGTSIFSGITNKWTAPQSFTANKDDKVYVRIVRYSGSGNYKIVYSTKTLRPDITLNNLTDNQWVDGSITHIGGEIWYSFNVTASTSYNLWWNDSNQGNGTKTLNARVSASYSDGTYIFSGYSSRWISAQSFTANKNDTIYVRVYSGSSSGAGSTGTFGIVYSSIGPHRPGSFPPSVKTTLAKNQWVDGSIAYYGDETWYTFDAAQNTNNYIWLNSFNQGDGSKTLSAYVYVYYSDGTAVTWGSGSWNYPLGIYSNKNDTIYVKVISATSGTGSTGTYSIAYSGTAAVRPDSFPPENKTALTENQWTNGNITQINGETWYSFEATASTYYYVWCNSLNQGDGTKTLNAYGYIYYSDGTQISSFDSLWNTPLQIYSGKSDTIFIKVFPNSSSGAGSTGTFSVVYSKNSLRPGMAWPPVGCTKLTENEITTDSIPNNEHEDWFTIDVTSGQNYHLWWNDGYQNSSYMYVYVSAWYSDGTLIFSNSHGKWTSPQSFNASKSGPVYINVVRMSGSGNYRILYSTNFIRPDLSVTPVGLTLNDWTDGNIAAANGEGWYTFEATSSTNYSIWWNDRSQGDSTKTLNARVSAYYSDGTSIFSDYNNRWYSPQSFTANKTDTIFIRVIPYSSSGTGSTGTFGIAYSTASVHRPGSFPPANKTPLTHNQWKDGNIANYGGEVWYTFDAAQYSSNYIWLNDLNQGDGSKTLYAYVYAYYSDGTHITSSNNLWNYPLQIYSNRNDTIHIKVIPYTAGTGSTGTFSIVYSTGSIRPGMEFPPSNHTKLTEGQWTNGNITQAGGEVWYSFNANASTNYYLWSNDSNQGDGTKTLNARFIAYNSDGTLVGSSSQMWNTPLSIYTTKNDTVYVKVYPYNSSGTGSTGTFGIAYSTVYTRPGFTIPSNYKALTNSVWENGEVTSSKKDYWYSISVTNGTSYKFWLNHGWQGDGTKTLGACVNAYKGDNTAVLTNMTNAWLTPQSYTADFTGTLYIQITGYYSNYTGTFSFVYNTSSIRPGMAFPPSNYAQLAENTWKADQTTTSNKEIWYSISVNSGTTYHIWWNESVEGDGAMTMVNPYVSAYYSDGTPIFTGAVYGWNNPRVINANRNDTIYILVAYAGNSFGTYGIVYSTGSTRP